VDDRRAEACRALDDVPLNTGFARAALELTGAPLWTDRAVEPRAFHVAHPYGMSLVWGPAVAEVSGDVVAHLRHRAAAGAEEWLQVDPRWSATDWDGALAAVPVGSPGADAAAVVRHTRVNFAFDAGVHATRRAARRPPAGWWTRPATAEDFALTGSVVPSGFWPDAATFLAAGGGTAVEREGEVGALAFTSYRSGTDLELGIETAPAHRRQGLAAAAAAAMLDDVLAAGLAPVWSCREDNVGSYRLAIALGFAPTTRTPYHHLRARPVA
jgi:RimJ/RimL family protein N-acetyltransferase